MKLVLIREFKAAHMAPKGSFLSQFYARRMKINRQTQNAGVFIYVSLISLKVLR